MHKGLQLFMGFNALINHRARAMYNHYFGLQETPFSIAINPRYIFMSARHRDALAHLLYGVGVGGGFILLTGEVGTGKTTINRCLLEQLPANTDIALVLNPALNASELLASVCDELSISYQHGEQSLKILSDKLHQYLLTNHANGRNTVLLIDEAQHLQFDVLEQIRLLTNLETNTKKLLQIILVGQPELRSLLHKPQLRQLAQRITARYQLKPLTLVETTDYIQHRLNIAGLVGSQQLFPAKIIRAIYRASRGIPRIINVLCDRMLLGAYGQNKTVVDSPIFKQALVEVMGEEENLTGQGLLSSRHWPIAVGAVVLLSAVLGAFSWRWFDTANAAINPPIAQNIAPQSTSLSQLPDLSQKPLKATAKVARLAAIDPISTHAEQHDQAAWIDDRGQAIKQLSTWLGYPPISSCKADASTDIRCEALHAASWRELRDYNRPVILSVISPDKFQRHVLLAAIEQDQAVLVNQHRISRMPLIELGRRWTGDFLLLWQSTPHYAKPLGQGDSGPAVDWLANQFATLDKQPQPLTQHIFNQSLLERVTIFQRDHQLQADGVAGLKTLLKLSEQLAPVITLNASVAITNKQAAALINSEKNQAVQVLPTIEGEG